MCVQTVGGRGGEDPGPAVGLDGREGPVAGPSGGRGRAALDGLRGSGFARRRTTGDLADAVAAGLGLDLLQGFVEPVPGIALGDGERPAAGAIVEPLDGRADRGGVRVAHTFDDMHGPLLARELLRIRRWARPGVRCSASRWARCPAWSSKVSGRSR